MKALITIQHGENVHLFKHAIRELQTAGHEVAVFAREKEVNHALLSAYDIDHTLLCGAPDGLVDLATVQTKYELRILRAARAFDPDVALTSHGIAGPHVATVLGATSLNFVDTEAHIAAQHRLFVSFSDTIYTPESLRSDFGDHQVSYPSLHELAYLHPDRFDPDPSVLTRRGIDPDRPYFVVRLNAWDAHHDIAKSGLTTGQVHELVEDLASHGDVYVSAEDGDLPDALPADPLPVDPHEVHHLMYYADLFVGDVSTMTVESAVLGTPTVRVSPFVDVDDMGKFRMLEDEYGLVYSFHTDQAGQALAVARSLASDPDATAAFAERREDLVADSIDPTSYILEQLAAHDPATDHEDAPRVGSGPRSGPRPRHRSGSGSGPQSGDGSRSGSRSGSSDGARRSVTDSASSSPPQ